MAENRPQQKAALLLRGRVFDAKKLRVVRMFVAETEDCMEPLPWRLPCLPGRKNCFLQGSALPSALAVG